MYSNPIIKLGTWKREILFALKNGLRHFEMPLEQVDFSLYDVYSTSIESCCFTYSVSKKVSNRL